jgi:pimeloyl-ACP methyl ester carboxylesterase
MTPSASTSPLVTGVPVTFQCEGCRLAGSMHHTSTDSHASLGVILLNQGPVDRAGSHRLYVKLANRLTQLGVPVLRFDSRGVGESEGAWDDEMTRMSVRDVYGRIQRGAWVPDAIAAIDYMRREVGIDRIVLGGLCGGAATALFAGATHPAVEGIFVIGTPVTFTSTARRVADLPEGVLKRDARRYLRKLVRPSSWARFLKLETDYRTLVHVFGGQLQRRLRRLFGPVAPSENDVINLPLLSALRAAIRRRTQLLFVFGQNDFLWQEFQQQLPSFLNDRNTLPFDLVTISDANHNLTEEPWQQVLFGAVESWMERMSGEARRRRA